MTALDITKMTVSERILAMEWLWDSLAGQEIESPQWHLDILSNRMRKLHDGTAELLSLDELARTKE
jgi:hypothetical protein